MEISVESISCSSRNTISETRSTVYLNNMCILIKMFCILNSKVLYKNQKYLVKNKVEPECRIAPISMSVTAIGLVVINFHILGAMNSCQILANISLFYF